LARWIDASGKIQVANLFFDFSAPAALRQMVSFCGWFSGQRPLNQPQNERKTSREAARTQRQGFVACIR